MGDGPPASAAKPLTSPLLTHPKGCFVTHSRPRVISPLLVLSPSAPIRYPTSGESGWQTLAPSHIGHA
jgi:hypothetical protein